MTLDLTIGLSAPIPVDDYAHASAVYGAARDKSRQGCSTWPEGVIWIDGKQAARISYNGRVWPLGAWRAGMKPIYDNR